MGKGFEWGSDLKKNRKGRWETEVWTDRDNDRVNDAELVMALLRFWDAGAGGAASSNRSSSPDLAYFSILFISYH